MCSQNEVIHYKKNWKFVTKNAISQNVKFVTTKIGVPISLIKIKDELCPLLMKL